MVCVREAVCCWTHLWTLETHLPIPFLSSQWVYLSARCIYTRDLWAPMHAQLLPCSSSAMPGPGLLAPLSVGTGTALKSPRGQWCQEDKDLAGGGEPHAHRQFCQAGLL